MSSACWVFIGVAFVLVILFRLAYNVVSDFRYYRGVVRKEFVAYVKQHHPDVEISSEGPKSIVLRKSGAREISFQPKRLYLDLAKIDSKDGDAKAKVFEFLIQEIVEDREKK